MPNERLTDRSKPQLDTQTKYSVSRSLLRRGVQYRCFSASSGTQCAARAAWRFLREAQDRQPALPPGCLPVAYFQTVE